MSNQGSALKFFNMLTEDVGRSIHSTMLGKIVRFDGIKMKAEVQPLVKTDGETKPMLIEVPVSFLHTGKFTMKPVYEPDDIVVILFADEDVDNVLLSGSVSDANSKRVHSMDDAIIIGSIMPFTEEMPTEHEDDMVFGVDDFETKVVIQDDGEMSVETDKKLTVKSKDNALFEIVIEEDGSIAFNSESDISFNSSGTVRISGSSQTQTW